MAADPGPANPDPLTIQRQKDGRHAVLNAAGQQLGLHNSVFSAARQIHEYYGAGGDPKTGPAEATHPAKVAKAHGVGKPKIPKPRVPRP